MAHEKHQNGPERIGRLAVFGVLWTTGGKFAGFALNFAGQLFLVRLLLPHDFGIFALAISFFQIFTVFIDGNFPLATIQMHDEPDLGDTAFVLCAAQGALTLVLSMAISYGVWLDDASNAQLPLLLLLLGARYALAPLIQLYDAQLQKNFRYKKLTVVTIISAALSTGLAVFMARAGFGVWSLFAREFVSIVINLAGYRFVSGTRFHWRFKKDAARKLFGFGKKMLVSSSLIATFNRMDNFLIELFLGVSGVGFYSQARYLGDLVGAAVNPANVVAFPLYASLKKEPERLGKSFQILNFFIIRVLFPFSIVFALFPENAMTFLFGEKWRAAAQALRGLALYPVLACVFANLETFLIGLGKIEITAWVRGVRIVCALGLMSLGARFYGLLGAALGFTSTYVIGLLAMRALGQRQPLKDLWKSLSVPTLSAALAISCVVLISMFGFRLHRKWEWMVAALLAIILYGLFLLVMEYRSLKANARSITSRLKAQ